jgi:endonuclease V-like protein UPF0215 family
LKSQVRVVGIDDSPFTFKNGRVHVVGVVMRIPNYIEAVMTSECEIDGTDANDVLVGMLRKSRYLEQLKLIMIDGIALGGFNIVDISHLQEATGIPSATVTRDMPDKVKIRSALKKHFPDWVERMRMIDKHQLVPIPTSHKPIYVSVSGMDVNKASELIQECTIRGNIPEPIRIAHLIARAIVNGESRGRP